MNPAVILALQSEHVTFWWITLGMGAVVVIAVIVLLSLLVSFVNDIDVNVREAWETATRLAANTATTWMLQQTGVRTEDLLAEVERHNELLASQGASR
ncbi:MAG: hypothetical protein M3N68_10245 [Actinomycetota bacterium]|nr:hypothetical protein [Actinomycetota bacterium]